MANEKQVVVILKNLGTSCNIGCVYCAEERKRYTSVEHTITEEQLGRIAGLTKSYSLNVLFHGGEPTLLNCEYYSKAMDIFEKVNSNVYFGIQTNAVYLDDSWINFFLKNKRRLGVSVSLDGPRSVNKYRLTKDKKETYDMVFDNVKLLEKNDIKAGMICTIVSAAIGKELELFEMLNEFNNLQFVKLNPCLDKNDDGSLPFWAVTPTQYFQFVANFFDILMKQSAWNKFYVEPILSILKNIQGVESFFCNFSNKKCSNFISIYPNGTITTCDNFDLQNGFLGNLNSIDDMETISGLQSNKSLLNTYDSLLTKCSNCEYSNICRGGCIAIRKRYSDSEEYRDGMKSMIKHISKAYKSVK
ncbi:MAG TPA: radical SAM protein [Spirochaetota bacterium]|nr:radical SAM protein [Spirochaetota bacterium]